MVDGGGYGPPLPWQWIMEEQPHPSPVRLEVCTDLPPQQVSVGPDPPCPPMMARVGVQMDPPMAMWANPSTFSMVMSNVKGLEG